MLVVFFCVMMKMLELSSAHVTASLANEDRRKLRQRRQRVPRRRRGAAAAARASQSPATGTGASVVASGTGAMDDGGGGRAASPALLLGSSPGAAHAHALALALERDCNSNAAGSFASESASLPDADFVQECQDYQWFLDYGYREGGGPQPGAGLLASLASSSGLTAPAGYEDLARDIDANLAEVDMEDFRSEDIHSVLSTLPAMCCGDLQAACEPGGEMFASVSGSLLARLEMDASSAGSPPSCGSQADDSAGSTDTMSLCKSELLFSPVKDCPLPGSNFSVDSLDCDLLTEHDIMLTCQANKDNYTIAFEGSVTLYSEDSDYHEPDLEAGGAGAAGGGGRSSPAAWAASARALRLGAGRARPLDSSMARSDSVYTTWSKLQKRSSDAQLASRRAAAEGGGPRDAGGGGHAHAHAHAPPGGSPVAGALKSQSLPNLSRRRRRCLLASLSGRLRPAAAAAAAMSSSAESDTRSPATTVKLYDVQQSSSGLSETNSSVDGGACSSCGSGSASGGGRRSHGGGAPQQHFSLVKLFMKQKSQSSERVGYAMDQSSASECWPASANSASEGDSDSFAQEAAVVAAAGRAAGAAASPPLTPPQPQPPPPSPHRRRALSFNDNATAAAAAGDREANGNDGGARTDTDLDVATNNWIRADDLAPTPGAELSASCLEDSLAEAAARRRLDAPRARARGRTLRQQRLDEDEDDDEEEEEEDDDDASERSESVEQLSESVSKIEESALDLGASSCGSSGPLSLSGAPPAPPLSSAACRPRLPSANNNSAPYAAACPARYAPPLTADNNNGSVEAAAAAAADEEEEERRAQATQTAPALMNRSVQTSTTVPAPAPTSAPAPPPPPLKVLGPGAAPRVAKLLAAKKPLFVFYPNYALPDLTFLQDKRGRLDAAAAAAATDAKVYLVPQTFHASPAPNPAPATTRGPEKSSAPAAPAHTAAAAAPGARAGARRGAAGRRPFSCTDVEALRRKGFAHVQDWESLTVLLPRECRRILEEVPELEAHLKAAAQVDEKPHFCASPPPPPPATIVTNTAAQGTPKSRRPRPASCGDCPADTGGALEPKGVPTSSSSSSTATQPSSGYRGSSTMLLTDSSGGPPPTTAPAYNPLFVYRYDSVSSEGSMMSTPAPPPKRSVSLPTGKKNPDKITSSPSPPRPPLPRGILRQPEKILAPAQTTITAYNCKVHKNQTNSKRYSMFELGACKGSSLLEDDEFAGLYDNDAKMRLGRLGPSRARAQTLGTASDAKEAARRLAACLHPEKDIDEAEDEEADEGVDADVSDDVSGGSIGEVLPPMPPMPPMPHRSAPVAAVDELVDDEEEADEEGEGAALSLEELLQVSALSALGPAAAAAAAAATDGSTTGWDDTQMQRLRLQVSKFLLGQQPTAPGADCRTPHNTPEHHAAGCACGPAHKKSVSFAERAAASPLREDHEMSPSSGSIGSIGSPTDTELAHQRGLVMAVAGAVDALVRLFSTTHDPVVAAPAAAELALTKLCPALYAVLGDGLKARLDTPFGAIPNSVWQVVEASAQQGPMTQALSELVLRINGEDVLSEGALRFNAFAFALLNARSLDAWLAFVRTRERVLRRHYAPPTGAGAGAGLLAAAAAGAPAARAALDRVVAALQPLALLPFRLDPLFEARRLHASLRRLRQLSPQGTAPSAAFCEDGPEAAGEPASPAPGANTNASAPGGAARQWTLRQLVRSIQSSLTASADEEAASATWLPPPPPPPRSPRRSPEALLRQALAGETASHHPNCSGASVAPAEPLPDLLAAGGGAGAGAAAGVGGGRWAPGERPRARPRSCTNPSAAAPAAGAAGAGFSLVTDLASTVRKRWSGIHLGSKLFQAFDRLAAEDSDEEYTDSLEPAPRASAGDPVPPAPPAPTPASAPSPSPSPAPAPAPAQASSPAVTTGSTGPAATGGGGKFRRLQMKWEMLSGKEGSSGGGGSAPGSPSPKSPKSPAATTTSPDGAGAGAGGRSKIPRPVSSPVRPSAIPVAGAARRTASSGAAPAAASPAPAKRPAAAAAATTARASRADRPAPGAAAARPSSLPYRAPSARPAARALPAARRAASSSQGRARGDAHAHPHPTPRFVRTLCHRLPTDSGHLSFNEGERLRVVLEVDAEWLLCCRGDRKGLVPRSAVIGADAA